MKRSLEAHTTLILALCDIYIGGKINDDCRKVDIIACINSVRATVNLENDADFQKATQAAKEKFKTLDLSKFFDRFAISFIRL